MHDKHTSVRSNGGSSPTFLTCLIACLAASFLFYFGAKSTLEGNKKERELQNVRVLTKDLDGTIKKFDSLEIEGLFKPIGNLPGGLLRKAKEVGKDEMIIGYVLLGDCSTATCQNMTKRYREKHSSDITWIEKIDIDAERIWLFLKQGTSPDPDFLKVVE